MYKTASSANRLTIVSLKEAGGNVRVVKAQLNISQKTYSDFKKIVECNMRQAPEDPIVEIHSMSFRCDDGTHMVVTEDTFAEYRP